MGGLIKKGLIRSSEEFKQLIIEVKLDHVRKGKNPPTTEQITRALARQIKAKDIQYDKYIQF